MMQPYLLNNNRKNYSDPDEDVDTLSNLLKSLSVHTFIPLI